MSDETRHVISIYLMENGAGALSRVSGLFSARGYNIESLTVAPTEDATLSRLTLVTLCSEEIVEQVVETAPQTSWCGEAHGSEQYSTY